MNGPAQTVSLAPATPTNKDLLDLFDEFKLKDYSQRISGALGVEFPSDFCDVNEAQILEASATLGLLPVQHNRMMALWRNVSEKHAESRNGYSRKEGQPTAIRHPRRSSLRGTSPRST